MVLFFILHSCIFFEYKTESWANAITVVCNSLFVKLDDKTFHGYTKLYWWMDSDGLFLKDTIFFLLLQ